MNLFNILNFFSVKNVITKQKARTGKRLDLETGYQ